MGYEKKPRPSFEEILGTWSSPWGRMGGVYGPDGLRRIELPHYYPDDLLDLLKWEHPGARIDDAAFAELADLCSDYFNRRAVDFSTVRCDLSGCGPFAQKILTACRKVPYGQTRSYSALAGLAGEPGKARPAAQALGKNPIPLVIPCHRIVLAAGRLGGFSAPGGIQLKSRLIELESQARP
ncbi:MAG: methylated-DNA--[protein]-cysteine S-methyltransferase [Planctomycetes bacterium]|nr:methylated-DNA--[protein]-cysteine S-methyltransferase [Planctomycetota bacterium]